MKKQTLLRLGVMLGIVCAALVCLAAADPPALEETKTLSVFVYDEDGNYTERELETTAQYLGQAMDELGLLRLQDTGSGTEITAVEDMLPADGTVWVYNINSEYSPLPVDDQPIADEDKIAFYQMDSSALPRGEDTDLEDAVIGTWQSDSGLTIEVSEHRVRLVGTANLPYELYNTYSTDGVYLVLDGDGAYLGDYYRLVCRYVNGVPTLIAQADSFETTLYKAE